MYLPTFLYMVAYRWRMAKFLVIPSPQKSQTWRVRTGEVLSWEMTMCVQEYLGSRIKVFKGCWPCRVPIQAKETMPHLLISYSMPTYLKALPVGELGLIKCSQVQGQQRVAVSHTVAVNLGNTLPRGEGRQKVYFTFQRKQDMEELTED